jgi:FeS assembly SUF system regulator
MIKVGKLTDYAIVMITALARQEVKIHKVADIAALTGIAHPTVAKIMKLLTRAQISVSERGAQGGYRLVKKPEEITMHDIIEAMEGPVALMHCLDEADQDCSITKLCGLKKSWQKINDEIKLALSRVTMKDMVDDSVYAFDKGKV